MGFFHIHTLAVLLMSVKWYIRHWRLPLPLHFCFRAEICNCFATRDMAAVFLPICETVTEWKIKFPALSTCLPPASLPWANPLTLLPSKSITSSAATTVLWLPTANSAVPLIVGILRPLHASVPHLSFHHSCWLQLFVLSRLRKEVQNEE